MLTLAVLPISSLTLTVLPISSVTLSVLPFSSLTLSVLPVGSLTLSVLPVGSLTLSVIRSRSRSHHLNLSGAGAENIKNGQLQQPAYRAFWQCCGAGVGA